MRRSARLFGAKLDQWSLPDGGGIPGWTAVSGSHDALIGRVTSLIRRAHASQFDAAAVRGLARLPSSQRVVFVAPAALALSSDSVFSCN